MRLLVSAATAADARAALEGGADIVDAKDPSAGALGAVSLATMRAIHDAVAGARPLTAALGDAAAPDAIEALARAFAGAGATFVKVGFAGVHDRARAARLAAAAARGAGVSTGASAGVVVVAYADAPDDALSPFDLLEVASEAGAAGVLLDTADKGGPGLLHLVTPSWLAGWVGRAHQASLLAAVAGQLRAGDLPAARDAGADVAGVRGAVCDGGRTGRVSAEKVRHLRRWCGRAVDVVA